MSTEPLTHEGLLEYFRDSDLRWEKRMEESRRESDERWEKQMERMKDSRRESDERWERKMDALRKQMKRTDERIGFIDSRIGELVEGMIDGNNIVNQFRNLGYNVSSNIRNETFGTQDTDTDGEIDMLLENSDVSILIEIKTKLTFGKILKHVKRLEKYRKWQNMQGTGKKRYIGAIACAIMKKETVQFAQMNGLYVIAQLGNNVEIVTPPEGFKAREW